MDRPDRICGPPSLKYLNEHRPKSDTHLDALSRLQMTELHSNFSVRPNRVEVN
jgi:hypothetical protein